MPEIIQGLIISADPEVAAEIKQLASAANPNLFLRAVQELSNESELDSLVRIYSPSLLFLDMDDMPLAEYVCTVIRERLPHTQIIGFANDVSREALMAAVRYSLRDVLQCPLSSISVSSAVQRAVAQLEATGHTRSQNRNAIFCVLPAKAGAGASTVAMHTAVALSRVSKQGEGRTALLDFDFECGVIDFMVNSPYDQGVKHLLEYSSRLDEGIWAKAAHRSGNLDIVRSGSHGHAVHTSAQEVREMLVHARANYDFTCLDLPGTLDEGSMAAIEFSDAVLLVCTPDLASAHIARRRMALLREYGFSGQIRVILNRNQSKSPLNKAEIEELLHTQVYAVIDNDYQGLQQALLKGSVMEPTSPVGKQFSELAKRLSGAETKRKSGEPGLWTAVKKMLGLGGASSKPLAPEPARTKGRKLLLPAPEAVTPEVELIRPDSDYEPVAPVSGMRRISA